jgi:CRP/FNR family cyclic AMP-dependent transcriptional regulator
MPSSAFEPSVDLSVLRESLRELAQRGVARHYRRGTLLIEEGTQGDTLYLLIEGRVKVFTEDTKGRELVYAFYGPGEFFGEMSLDGGPRSASVVTVEPTLCVFVTRQTLSSHIAEHPEFAFELIGRVIQRARMATASARNMALMDVYGRLVQLFESTAARDPSGQLLVSPRLTHHDIAARVGSSREMVSRLLKGLVDGGFVEVQPGAYRLVRPLPKAW